MTSSEVVEALRKVGVPVGAVNTMREIIDDPQVKATQTHVRILHNKTMMKSNFDRALIFTKLPVRTSEYNPNAKEWPGKPTPDVGENTVELLQELGYSEEQILDLRNRRIVAPYLEEMERKIVGRRRR